MDRPPPHDDVRMRGFAARSTVEAALRWVDAHSSPLPGAHEPIASAHGRVLTEDVVSALNVPAFARSAMDGYALRAAETSGAGIYNPLTFRVVGQSLPGRACEVTVKAGEAVRIMTGAPLPEGADAVVPAEYTRETDDGVEITEPIAKGKHVGRVGEDIAAGTTVLPAGRRLRPQDVGVLASLGIAEVPMVGQPRVRIVVTGNELVPPGEERGAHQIFEANSYVLRGLVARDGGQVDSVVRVPDDRDAIREALTAPGADVVLVSGGTSVGAEDHAPSIVAEAGELAIHGVAMRPSSPTGMGLVVSQSPNVVTRSPDLVVARSPDLVVARSPDRATPPTEGLLPSGETCGRADGGVGRPAPNVGPAPNVESAPNEGVLVFLLPGNPVSCLCAYDFFAGRAIRRLGGRSAEWPYRQSLETVSRKIVSAVGRVDYCRIRRDAEGIVPLAVSGASVLSSTTRADGFVVVRAESEGHAPGDRVRVYWYDET